MILKIYRGTFNLWRQNVRFRYRIFPMTDNSKVIIMGSGAPADGKSAAINFGRSTFLINCPEPTQVIAGFTGIRARIEYLLLTRAHWDNVGGISSFMQVYYPAASSDCKEPLKIFGLKKEFKNTLVFQGVNDGLVDLMPIERVVEQDHCVVRSYKLGGGTELPTFAYHITYCPLDSYTGQPYMNASVLVLEVANRAHMASFLSNSALQQGLRTNPPNVVLHFSGRHLQDDPDFRALVSGLPAASTQVFLDGERPSFLNPAWLRRHVVRHFFQNRRAYPIPPYLKGPLTAAQPHEVWRDLSAKEWCELERICSLMRSWLLEQVIVPDRLSQFPGGLHDKKRENDLLPPSQPEPAPIGLPNCWSAHSLLTLDLEDGSLTNLLDLSLDTSRLLASSIAPNFHFEFEDLRTKAKQLGEKINRDVKRGTLPPITRDFPKLVFLGTGSATSTKHRNVSGVLLRISSDSCLLLDCGAGTLHRMFTFLGAEETLRLLRGLKAILITHDHLDHYMGLPSLLTEWRKVSGRQQKIAIIANPFVLKVAVRTLRVFCHELRFEQLDIRRVVGPSHVSLAGLPGLRIETVPVNHKALALGYNLRHSDGWHILFSGDTGPCSKLLQAGQDCDLLVHEATHADGEEDMAKRNRHSTIGQALSAAKHMRAKRVVLTHFSTRSEHCPVCITPVPDHVVLASDGLQVGLDDVFYFRGDQVKTLANSLSHSFSLYNLFLFSEPPTFDNPPRLDDSDSSKTAKL